MNDINRILAVDGEDIMCMKEFDALKYPCDECNRKDCEEREEYHKKDKFAIK